jgi:hypothetical protein
MGSLPYTLAALRELKYPNSNKLGYHFLILKWVIAYIPTGSRIVNTVPSPGRDRKVISPS